MAVKQLVLCDQCQKEIDGCGFHLGIGKISWADDETIDEDMEGCSRHSFHLCDGCAGGLAPYLPPGAGVVILPGLHKTGMKDSYPFWAKNRDSKSQSPSC